MMGREEYEQRQLAEHAANEGNSRRPTGKDWTRAVSLWIRLARGVVFGRPDLLRVHARSLLARDGRRPALSFSVGKRGRRSATR